MNKVLVSLIVLTMSFVAQGAEQPINDGVSIVKQMKNGNFMLGRVMLNEADRSPTAKDNDTFSMPSCRAANKRIRGVRLRAPRIKKNGRVNLDALIRSMTVVFGNGQAKIYNLNNVLRVSEFSGDGLTIRFQNSRCVRSISVLGEQFEAGRNRSNAQVNVVGVR